MIPGHQQAALERGASRSMRLTWLSSQNLQTFGAEKSLSQNTEKSTQSAEDVHERSARLIGAQLLREDSMGAARVAHGE